MRSGKLQRDKSYSVMIIHRTKEVENIEVKVMKTIVKQGQIMRKIQITIVRKIPEIKDLLKQLKKIEMLKLYFIYLIFIEQKMQ